MARTNFPDKLATCSYAGSSTQLDLFNLIQVNEAVDLLQKRVRSLESDLQQMREKETSSPQPLLRGSSEQRWALSLTPHGLRIDTNIISLHDLYHILTSNFIPPAVPSSRDDLVIVEAKLWKSEYKTFPLYSTWESPPTQPLQLDYPEEHSVPKQTLDRLIGVYQECFICLSEPWNDNTLSHRYFRGDLDPLLANIIFAWSARHGAIYHGLFPGQDPNLVGEPFFNKAKALLKERFTNSSLDTVHALLVMHNYVIGKTGHERNQAESEAYMYLGLAIRMCLDLKMHRESQDIPIQRERNRRFFWLAYFLETLCTLNIGKPLSLQDDHFLNLGYPAPLNHEIGPIRWRVEFMSQRFRIIRIYRRLMALTTAAKEQQPLSLQTITALDKQIKDWYAALEPHFRYNPHDPKWKHINAATWMRDMGCLKLNVEHHYTLMQLYSLFLSSSPATGAAMNLLARQISRSSADNIVDLIECWTSALPKEAWCHFALEPVMVVTRVYMHLCQEGGAEVQVMKGRMERIASILAASPIQHQRPVRTILETIRGFVGAAQQPSEEVPLLDHWSSSSLPFLSSDFYQDSTVL
ncbi:fungal-specific transcription factor domain-containing protein [Fennellomyces sp. T-0311]|nr:fungal-specific transcription factor domain-containing protein [Fennellomyces sp. T-0311]